MKNKRWWIVLIVVLCFWGAARLYHYWHYQPHLNPNPQYYMVIKGHVAPELVGKVQLKWRATYSSTIKACDKTYNWFEGVDGWRWVTDYFTARVDERGDYLVKIPLDKYRPGFCRWQIASVDDEAGTNFDGMTIANFYPCGSSISCEMHDTKLERFKTKAHYARRCILDHGKLMSCKLNKNATNFSNNLVLPRQNNYIMIENFTIK